MQFSQYDDSSVMVYIFEDYPGAENVSLRKEIDFTELCCGINEGVWEYEIVDELYGFGCGMFIGYLHQDEEPYRIECQVSLWYKELVYNWNEIRPERIW